MTLEKFKKIEKRLGIFFAVKKTLKSESRQVLNHLKTEQWLEVFKIAYPNSEIERVSLEKIVGTRKSFNYWLEMREKFSFTEWKCKELCLEMMIVEAKNLEELIKVHGKTSHDSKAGKKSFIRIREIAEESFEQCFNIYKMSSKCIFCKKIFLEIMLKKAKTFEHWKEIKGVVYYDSYKLRELSFIKMKEMAKTFEHWKEINKASSCPYELRELSFIKMKEMAKTFEHWKELNERARDKIKEKKISLIMMTEEAETLDQWEEVLKRSPSNSDSERLASKKIIEKLKK
jgi:hypothetical protein